MHYIRLVSPPSIVVTLRRSPVLFLKLSITTDLGDSFLSNDEPIELVFLIDNLSDGARGGQTGVSSLAPLQGSAHWKAGMRVLKVELALPNKMLQGRYDLSVWCRRAEKSATETQQLLPWRAKDDMTEGLIAPLLVELCDGRWSDVALRPCMISFTPGTDLHVQDLCIEEDIGESIARHIWDAGLMTTALLAESCRVGGNGLKIKNIMPIAKDEISILELGSGVGILGLGVAMLLPAAADVQDVKLRRSTVLLTDLPEAEERATANINRYQRHRLLGEAMVETLYENLDWDDGSKGRFGPLVASRFWDYIILSDCTYNVDSFPVLVATLSSLHTRNLEHVPANDNGSTTTEVILSTKPRHDSEKMLFGMLEEAGWSHRLLESIPLRNLGSDDEVVEVYSLEKRSAKVVF